MLSSSLMHRVARSGRFKGPGGCLGLSVVWCVFCFSVLLPCPPYSPFSSLLRLRPPVGAPNAERGRLARSVAWPQAGVYEGTMDWSDPASPSSFLVPRPSLVTIHY